KDPMFKEIVTFDGDMVVDGFIPLSEKPGIGVDINEEAMRQYAPQGVPFFA
ncbi:MAG: mandelate racemase/muconate lactonizing enzyme family protein, partial [Pseudomonadota bacterium]|nr:mandelate racemase/muconate lactonizing enzyme family protein [Pseudomonadota bacterium]